MCLTVSHLFKEMQKYPDMLDELVNFLEAPTMNHLQVTFPTKIIANILSQEPEEVSPYLTYLSAG